MNDNFHNKTPIVYVVTLAVIALLCVVSMGVWAREGDSGILHAAQQSVTKVLSPLSVVSQSASNTGNDVSRDAENSSASQDTLSSLKEQNAELTAQVAKGEEYRQEAQRLQELLNLKDQYSIDGVSGHVIGRTTENWNQTITVDVGTNDGSFVGATVCASFGVIGQVTSVTDTTSVVRLLTDPQSGVAGMIQSSRATCVVKGSLDGLIVASNISAGTNVSGGDIIITSGLGGSFTKGIIIGTVTKVTGNSQDGSLEATVKQTDKNTYEEVIIVKSAGGDSSSGGGSN